MENWIIGAVVVLIAGSAVAVLWSRRGRKGCCGSGGSHKPRKKKLRNVISTRIFPVEGMHCDNCANRVTEIINDIPGAAGVVDLKKGVVTVSCDREVPEALLRERLARHGYTLGHQR